MKPLVYRTEYRAHLLLMKAEHFQVTGDFYELSPLGVQEGATMPTEEELNEAIQKVGIIEQIEALEISADKPRRRREAATTEEGKQWLVDVNNQIAALRAQL